MTRRATVALVEWNWGGHNQTYFKNYCAALAECGAAVVPVVSKPEAISEVLERSVGAESVSARDSIAEPVVFSPSRLLRIRPTRLAVQLRAFATFQRLGAALRNWERRHRSAIDLVFFACMYDDDFPRARIVSAGLRKNWAGLYLQGRVFHRLRNAPDHRRRRQAISSFSCKGLRALGVLEPRMLELVSQALPALQVRMFPDILEPLSEVETDEAKDLRDEIVKKSGGRPVVSLLGHLQPSKGVEVFLRAACDPRLSDVSFFLGGPLHPQSFSSEGFERIQALIQRAPALHVHLHRLSESSFNAAARASEILFASYVDFPYSSNVQGKAAQLGRPLIVTEGTLMGERCVAYGLGECVRENDLDSVVAAIRKILASRSFRLQEPSIRRLHAEYVALHDQKAVVEAMAWMLDRCGL